MTASFLKICEHGLERPHCYMGDAMQRREPLDHHAAIEAHEFDLQIPLVGLERASAKSWESLTKFDQLSVARSVHPGKVSHICHIDQSAWLAACKSCDCDHLGKTKRIYHLH